MTMRTQRASATRFRRLAILPALTLFATLLIGGCATSPTHPALREAPLPKLLPVRRYVADTSYSASFQLSPNGNQLVWHQAVGVDAGLGVAPIPPAGSLSGKVVASSSFATGRLASWYSTGVTLAWLPDSRHFLYLKDFTGDENTQIFVQDAERPASAPFAVTPWRGARSLFVAGGPVGSSKFFFQSNRRDPAANDLFEFDALTQQTREVARSGRDVIAWIIDIDGQLGGRLRQTGSTSNSDRALELLDSASGQYREVKRVNPFEALWALRLDRQRGKLLVSTNGGRDKVAVLEVDLKDGRERMIFESASVDVRWSVFAAGQYDVLAVRTDPGYPRFDVLDASLQADLDAARQQAMQTGVWSKAPVSVGVNGVDAKAQRMIVRASFDDGEHEYLFDRADKRLQLLSNPGDTAERATFAPMQPFDFRSSDGLTINGYWSSPKGAGPQPPLVVLIHGGPWSRDFWQPGELDAMQFLSNRGYAVMTVNYRGSTGYGQAFTNAAIKTLHDRSQQDIYEAVQWALKRGIADPKRVAVFGGSFGGYSTMAQMIQWPQDYQCGVNIVGVANWPRVIEKRPAQWENFMHYFERFYGDVRDPAERARMMSQSPITQIDKITAPMLVIHGANDIRVSKQDSDEVVAELQRLGRPVQYLLFADEGHSIRRWPNRLKMYRAIEDFLAGCLGGRAAGFDFFQLWPG
jgi:dipeptidyl aminopeptidase/acylaminoacyl peptidase